MTAILYLASSSLVTLALIAIPAALWSAPPVRRATDANPRAWTALAVAQACACAALYGWSSDRELARAALAANTALLALHWVGRGRRELGLEPVAARTWLAWCAVGWALTLVLWQGAPLVAIAAAIHRHRGVLREKVAPRWHLSARTALLALAMVGGCVGVHVGQDEHGGRASCAPRGALPAGSSTVRVAALGGSATYGFLMRERDVYVSRAVAALEAAAGDGRSYEALDCALSGADSRADVSQLTRASASDPRVVVLYPGFNHVPEDVPGLRRDLETIVDESRRGGRAIVLVTAPIGTPWVDRDVEPNQTIRAVATARGVPLLDAADAFGRKPWLFTLDLLHPNALGHALLGRLLVPMISAAAAEADRLQIEQR
ncbi:MAG: SGNH/GDSL hydrolase family protein [bacterium]